MGRKQLPKKFIKIQFPGQGAKFISNIELPRGPILERWLYKINNVVCTSVNHAVRYIMNYHVHAFPQSQFAGKAIEEVKSMMETRIKTRSFSVYNEFIISYYRTDQFIVDEINKFYADNPSKCYKILDDESETFNSHLGNSPWCMLTLYRKHGL